MKGANQINIHPGLILKEEVIEANGLSISETAGLLAISKLTLSEIATGKGPITPNIALRVEMVFGGSADFWLRMQRGYDLIEERIKFLNNPPKITHFYN